jgi:hypothetical protein
MSGAASRSQFSRFAKRRLMLLMLKLAIFIGSDGSERIDFNGRIAPSVAHPNQNLMQWKVSERPAPLAGAASAPKPKLGQNNQTNSGQEGGGACASQADWPTFSIKSSEPTQSKVLRRRFPASGAATQGLGRGHLSVIGICPAFVHQTEVIPMGNYRYRNGGHAPGHVRDMFLSAIESFEAWPTNTPEPMVDFEVRFEPRPITLTRACGIVWNCSDILPGSAFETLIDCGLQLKRRTYAAAARAMSERIKESMTVS